MATYFTIEFPKWIGDVLFQNAAEEQAHRAALERAVASDNVQTAPSTPEKTAEQMRSEALRARFVELLTARRADPAEPVMAPPAPELARPLSPAAERMRRTRERLPASDVFRSWSSIARSTPSC